MTDNADAPKERFGPDELWQCRKRWQKANRSHKKRKWEKIIDAMASSKARRPMMHAHTRLLKRD